MLAAVPEIITLPVRNEAAPVDIPPVTLNAPVEEDVPAPLFVIVVTPPTSSVLDKVVAPVTLNVVPICTALLIPTPPITRNAPEVVLVESVPPYIYTCPLKYEAAPVYIPPVTLRAPVEDEVLAPLFEIVVTPLTSNVLDSVVAPVTFNIFDKYVPFVTRNPPDITVSFNCATHSTSIIKIRSAFWRSL